MYAITNLANAQSNKKGMWRWNVTIHHCRLSFGYLSLRWLNTTTWHYVGQDIAYAYVCMCGFTRVPVIHASSTAPKGSSGFVCSGLINPMMTEGVWQFVYAFGLGWKVKWRNMRMGLMPNPPKGKRISSRSPFGQVLHVGSSANSLVTVCRHKSETYGLSLFYWTL